jgi:hypothetical protein
VADEAIRRSPCASIGRIHPQTFSLAHHIASRLRAAKLRNASADQILDVWNKDRGLNFGAIVAVVDLASDAKSRPAGSYLKKSRICCAKIS